VGDGSPEPQRIRDTNARCAFESKLWGLIIGDLAASCGPRSTQWRSNLPVRSDPRNGAVCVSVDDKRPNEFFLAPVGGNRYRKQLTVEASVEVGRLTAIRSCGFDLVLGADRYLHFLDVIPIQITKVKLIAAIGPLRPPFED